MNQMQERIRADLSKLMIAGHGNVRTEVIVDDDTSEFLIVQYRVYSDPRGVKKAKSFDSADILNGMAGIAEADAFLKKVVPGTGYTLKKQQPPKRSASSQKSVDSLVNAIEHGVIRAAIFANRTEDGDTVYKVRCSCSRFPAWSAGYACACRAEDAENTIRSLHEAKGWIDADRAKYWTGQMVKGF